MSPSRTDVNTIGAASLPQTVPSASYPGVSVRRTTPEPSAFARKMS